MPGAGPAGGRVGVPLRKNAIKGEGWGVVNSFFKEYEVLSNI